MEVIAFDAVVKDGRIEIPEEYRAKVTKTVHVVLHPEPSSGEEDAIARLLNRPAKSSGARPIRRDELYGRG